MARGARKYRTGAPHDEFVQFQAQSAANGYSEPDFRAYEESERVALRQALELIIAGSFQQGAADENRGSYYSC